MSERVFNFSAGPAILPEPVLETARDAMLSLGSSGIGILEHSHRSPEFTEIITSAEANIRKLIDLGLKFIAVERRVDEIAEELLTDAGVMVMRRMARRDISAILDHCGARAWLRPGRLARGGGREWFVPLRRLLSSFQAPCVVGRGRSRRMIFRGAG